MVTTKLHNSSIKGPSVVDEDYEYTKMTRVTYWSVGRFGLAVRRQAGKRTDLVRVCFGPSFSSKVAVYGHWLVTLPLAIYEIFQMSHSAAHLKAESFWWKQRSVRNISPRTPGPSQP